MNDETKQPDAVDPAIAQDVDFELMFAPSWARQTPEDATQRTARYAESERSDSFSRGAPRFDERDRMRRPRPPRRDAASPYDGDRRQPRQQYGTPSERSDARRSPRRERGAAERGSAERRFEQSPPPPRKPVAPLALDVRFLPEQKALGAIIRRIQLTSRAYPLRDIVRLFQKSDESMLVRLTATKEAGDEFMLYQCRTCGMPALSEDEVREHLLQNHLEEYYDVEVVEGEPPAGNFPCVARCGLSGEYLGPPNHHSFATRVAEMLRERYPHLSEEEYRSRIVMAREPEAVEEWREANRRKRLYRRKVEAPAEATAAPADKSAGASETTAEGETAGEPAEAQAAAPDTTQSLPDERPVLERQAAELQFAREIVPQQIGGARQITCPATALAGLANRRLANLLNSRFNEEAKRNGTLYHAIHGAFRHRGLHLFRANDPRGPEFVVGLKPAAMTATHVVALLREIVAFVTANACCAPQELLEALVPAGDQNAVNDINTHLKWMVEKGHLVQYFNGMLTLPAEFPTFRPHAKRAKQPPKAAATPAAEPATDSPATPAATQSTESDIDSASEAAAEPISEAAAPPPSASATEDSTPQTTDQS